MSGHPDSEMVAERWEPRPEIARHASAGQARPLLLWRLPEPMLAIASTPLGGGVGLRRWVINAQVGKAYSRLDVEDHLREISRATGVAGEGVGMLTAACVESPGEGVDGGVRCFATVGLSAPAWASAAAGLATPSHTGTINVIAIMPVRLGEAALVNAVMTATEAKAQALLEANVPGTGTASDALCVVCPAGGPAERFCGPRSAWGGRLARAAHEAVATGIGRVGEWR